MGCGDSTEVETASDLSGELKTVLLVVEKATNVPNKDLTGESDPYVKIRVCEGTSESSSKGQVYSEPEKTLARQDNANPVWNAYRKIVVHTTNSFIEFTMWDEDLVSKDDIIGTAKVDFSSITLGESTAVPIAKNCELFFRVEELDESRAKSCTKRLICIRHGESQWNESQENMNLVGMYEQKDHPLNGHGIGQAMHLNEAWKEIDAMEDATDKLKDYNMTMDDFNAFKSAQIIFASPLCRASQTCILSLMDHPTLTESGLTLMSNIRESKKIGGLDTAASTCGEDIRPRVEKQIKKAYDGDDKEERIQEWDEKFPAIKWDFNDTYEKWWTDSVDRAHEILKRFDDVFMLLRYIPEDTIILVGHSLFFQAFFRNYLNIDGAAGDTVDSMMVSSEEEAKEADAGGAAAEEEMDMEDVQDKEKLYAKLRKGKLMNAGCALCDVHFSDDLEKNFEITDVKLMFGTKLVK